MGIHFMDMFFSDGLSDTLIREKCDAVVHIYKQLTT